MSPLSSPARHLLAGFDRGDHLADPVDDREHCADHRTIGMAAARANIGERVLGGVTERLEPRKFEEAAIALDGVDEAEDANRAARGRPAAPPRRRSRRPGLRAFPGIQLRNRRSDRPSACAVPQGCFDALCRGGVNAALSVPGVGSIARSSARRSWDRTAGSSRRSRPRGCARARRRRRAARPSRRSRLAPESREAPGRAGCAGPRPRITSSICPSVRSAPTSSRPPRTRASPARSARLSSSLTAPLGNFSSPTIQPSSIRRSAPEHALERALRLVGVDLFPEAAAGAERQTEEFELVGRRPRAVGEQFEALVAHLRVVLVGEQLDTVVERADRRHQIVAKPRTKQTGEIDRVHRAFSWDGV